MIIIERAIPKGVIERAKANLLPAGYAQSATNCDFNSGVVSAFNGLTDINTPSKSGTKQTIYKFNDSYWFHWTTDVDCIRGPVSDDDDEVTYFTGDGSPKITDATVAVTGAGTDYPLDSYLLGVPAPTSAPTAAVTGSTLDPGNEVDRAYLITYVCEIGSGTTVEMEGPNSDPSNTVTTTESLSEAITLANELKVDIASHFASATRHTTGQQSTATLPAEATTLATLLALVTVELTLFAAHNADAILAAGWAYHNAQAADKALASAVAPTTLDEAIDRLNDLRTKYNDHEDETVGHNGTASVIGDQASAYEASYVTLTLPAFPAGDYNFTAKRIYRTQNAGEAQTTEYLYVGEVSGDTLTYIDTVSDNNLGEAIESTTWDPPPTDLHSLKLHPAGFMVGASGLDLCVSVAYQPHAWPTAWRLKLDYPIVGISIFGMSILVTTTAIPYLFTGTTPDGLAQEKTEILQACVSKRGIVNIGGAAIYPSPDGLFLLGMGIAKNATEKIFKRSDWQALNPSSMLGAYHDNKYYGFYSTGGTQGGIIFDLTTQDLSFTDVYATAVFVDIEDDILYLQVGNDIVSWNTDSSNPLTPVWKGRQEEPPYQVNAGFAQVFADSYPVTFKLYASNSSGTMELKHTETVASDRAFPLPSGYISGTFEVEITGEFNSFQVAETIHDLKRAP